VISSFLCSVTSHTFLTSKVSRCFDTQCFFLSCVWQVRFQNLLPTSQGLWIRLWSNCSFPISFSLQIPPSISPHFLYPTLFLSASPPPPLFPSSTSSPLLLPPGEYERVQKKAFTNWVNSHLIKVNFNHILWIMSCDHALTPTNHILWIMSCDHALTPTNHISWNMSCDHALTATNHIPWIMSCDHAIANPSHGKLSTLLYSWFKKAIKICHVLLVCYCLHTNYHFFPFQRC